MAKFIKITSLIGKKITTDRKFDSFNINLGATIELAKDDDPTEEFLKAELHLKGLINAGLSRNKGIITAPTSNEIRIYTK